MSVIQSIGARYIPIFADPIEWNTSNSYERLTIVQHQGDTYISKIDVPANTPITNETYWILFATFNAQYETLRSRVNYIDNKTDTIEGEITDDIFTVKYRKCANNVMLVISCVNFATGIKTIELPELLQPNIDIDTSYITILNDHIIIGINDNHLVINVVDGQFRVSQNLTLNYII